MIENNIFLEYDKEIYAFGLTQMIRAVVDDNREPDNERQPTEHARRGDGNVSG